MSSARVLVGDCLASMRDLPNGVARCCVTSPPYYGLRDYGHEGQIGLEETPDAYLARLVEVFREVRRVLTDDGTLWLNLGDSYSAGDGARRSGPQTNITTVDGARVRMIRGATHSDHRATITHTSHGMPKPKDLIGIPWRVAFALQADGWYLRSDIIWHKPNPMPESVTDRPTKSHEYLFLLAKSGRYFYDAGAIAETATTHPGESSGNCDRKFGESVGLPPGGLGRGVPWMNTTGTRNARTVWTIPTRPFKGAHFAVFPPALAERCILAGSAVGDTVLDPFGGSGTTGMVAVSRGRNAILCELNPEYAAMAERRLADTQPGLGLEAA